MKACAGLLCLGAIVAAPAWAIPCGVATLDVYIGLGAGGCTLGSLPLTFKDFGFSVTSSGGAVVAAVDSEITVTPSSGPQGTLEAARLTFTSPKFNVNAAEFVTYLITYTVDPPPVIIESDLDLSAESPVSPGRVNILEDLCIGAAFVGSACGATPATLNVFHNGTPLGTVRLHDDTGYGGSNIVGVRLSIDLRANGASSNFTSIQSGTLFTPEPATPLAMAGGLLALAGLRRRDFMRLAIALPLGATFARFRALAAAQRNQVKITGIQAMQLRTATGNCLIRVDTDAGLSGYGEAGATGPMARARIETMKRLLIGQDPLAIERHFHNMTTLMHTYMAHIPTISGIDIALWDLAGKITGLPVSVLLGGPFRDAIPMYSHGDDATLLDPASCRAWAQRIKKAPEGFTAFKISIDRIIGVPSARYTATLDSAQLRKIARAYMNAREAVGEEIDIAVHCHNEFDTPSAIAVAKAVEPANPLFLEDPLNVPFSEGWAALKRSTRVPILTGEKLEMVSGFRPFLDRQAADIIHPDLAFAGGITGTRKIAHYAALTRTPVALHNVGTLVLTYASAHFGSSIQNFYRSESALGRPTRQVEDMAASNPPEVRNSQLKVPTTPGLGVDLNPDFLKKNLSPGETFWS